MLCSKQPYVLQFLSCVSCAYIKEREKETALNFITFTDIETLFDLSSYFALSCISSVINQRIYVRYDFSLCRYISAFAVMQAYLIRVDGSSQILHPFVSLCSRTTRKALTTCGGAHLEKKRAITVSLLRESHGFRLAYIKSKPVPCFNVM